MLVLVTGAAGFIGFHTARRLLVDGHTVIGLDNLNDYYDVRLKHSRLAILREYPGFTFVKLGLEDRAGMARLFNENRFDRVVHLGAQAGVAYSMENPEVYATANLVGFLHVLEGCRRTNVPHLVYASSSSVYGANTRMPFTVHDGVDHPLSLYGATKRANELMAHSYSHLYGLPASGLRFFTVYGEYGRPDMVFFLFTKAILEGRPIDVYNFGDMKRDFTYIDDVIEAVSRVMNVIPTPDPTWSHDVADAATSMAPFRLYNIGNSEPVHLLEVIDLLEQSIGKKAIRNLLPIRPGDVPATYADASCLEGATGFKTTTHVREGIPRFVAWYIQHYAQGAAKVLAS